MQNNMYNLPPPNLLPPNINYPAGQLASKPPEDAELKNIIDKLANFVSRNGPEFENVTKEKQKDNPKFHFLFGGVHYDYYQQRLNIERDLCKFLINFIEYYIIFK